MTDQQSGMGRDFENEQNQGTDDQSGGREYGGGTGTDYGTGTEKEYGGGEGGAGDIGGGQSDMGGGQGDLGGGQQSDWERGGEGQGGNR